MEMMNADNETSIILNVDANMDDLKYYVVLAIDQVLRKHWLELDHFLDFNRLVEDGVPRRS